MALPSTGPLTLSQIAAEFGKANNLGALYGVTAGIPSSGSISMGMFYGKSAGPPIGQAVFLHSGLEVTPSIHSFVVPVGVTSICAVCVGMHPGFTMPMYPARILRGATVLLSSETVIGSGVGGGNGGVPTSYHGGGAGGYSGNGGNAGSRSGNGTNGTGGGGGGGGIGMNDNWLQGGAVGLCGQGNNGTGAVYTVSRATHGSYSSGIPIAGAAYGNDCKGGNLRWKNGIVVTPGETLTIDLGTHMYTYGAGANAGIRIIWGTGRAYPSTNTLDQ